MYDGVFESLFLEERFMVEALCQLKKPLGPSRELLGGMEENKSFPNEESLIFSPCKIGNDFLTKE